MTDRLLPSAAVMLPSGVAPCRGQGTGAHISCKGRPLRIGSGQIRFQTASTLLKKGTVRLLDVRRFISQYGPKTRRSIP